MTAEADVLLCKVLVVSSTIDFLRKSLREKCFRLFSGYFIIIFSRMCLRDQIFRVLLEHFISEIVRK